MTESDDRRPILHIYMQDPDPPVWCGECGRDVPLAKATTERIVGDSGIVGHRYVCLRCAKRIGLED